jgi:hypothetical protein
LIKKSTSLPRRAIQQLIHDAYFYTYNFIAGTVRGIE